MTQPMMPGPRWRLPRNKLSCRCAAVITYHAICAGGTDRKTIFTRFDGCEFVKCTLLIDHDTEQLAFTECVLSDCNIDKLEPDEERGLYARDNFFDRPLEERRIELENWLAAALAARKAKGKWTTLANDPGRLRKKAASGCHSKREHPQRWLPRN
jgi:hypothetical protein